MPLMIRIPYKNNRTVLLTEIFFLTLIYLYPPAILPARESLSKNLSEHQSLKFEHLSLEEGLSQNSVFCIFQDRKGFMWFGTEDGLNKYDGYTFTHFKNDPDNPYSISHNNVWAICEDPDENGKIFWIGTNGGGLNRFDLETETFTHYKHHPDSQNSLSHNNILTLYIDQAGILWIGTNAGGLTRFDRKTETFTRFRHNPANPQSIGSHTVWAICEDRFGTLWFGTEGAGLNKLVPSSDENNTPGFEQYKHDPNNPESLGHNTVWALYVDQAGQLWAGTEGGGLNKFNFETEAFTRFKHDPNNPHSLSNDIIFTIYQAPDEPGTLWIGTLDGGLNKFFPAKDSKSSSIFRRFTHDPLNPQSLSQNIVLSIYKDRTGMLWVGTYNGGLNKADNRLKRFAHYQHVPGNANSLSSNTIFALCAGQSSVLWIGMGNGGLNKFDIKTEEFTRYPTAPKNPAGLHTNIIHTLYEDRAGTLWIGSYGEGLYKMLPGQSENPAPEKQSFVQYKHDPENAFSLSHNDVTAIYEDRAGTFWIGTLGGGLNKVIPGEDGESLQTDNRNSRLSFKQYRNDPQNPNSLSDDAVRFIHEDRAGNLWTGTYDGLNRLSRNAGKGDVFTRYKNEPGNPNSLSHDRIHCIHEDGNGALWIGTARGLSRMSVDNQGKASFKNYREKDGLPNDVVFGILEDHYGNLWLSTNNGLSKFNPRTESFKNYDVSDGLQSNQFTLGAFCKGNNGEMFFGGIQGFNRFYPDSIRDNTIAPQIALTGFKIFNESVSYNFSPFEEDAASAAGDVAPLQTHISETKEITLSYKQNVLTFEFAALHYAAPEKNQYAYKMEGFDEDWVYSGNKREATYTNLDPGEYIFRVKGSNNDDIWNEAGTSLKIIIMPPFWQTWWFRAFAFLMIAASVVIWHKKRLKRLEDKKKALEIQVKERTEAAQALQNALSEVEQLKNRLQAENIYLQDEIKLTHNFSEIITNSEALKKILHKVEKVASTDTAVLILGESGTGKELLARAVHNLSDRRERPLVKINCAALPSNLIESELFGHEKGAFTGAVSRKIGRFELANGGTIFLDEIGELPLELQPKLLRVLQEGEIERLGNPQTIQIDVRIIAATNRDLEKEIENGQFREDLFYRLNVFPIKSPPLRERKEDIPLLANHFIKKYATKAGKQIDTISQELINMLQTYHWPGNVRELENIIERAVVVSQGKKLKLDDWLPKASSAPTTPISTLEENERKHIIAALRLTNWRISGEKGAAKILGIHDKTLYSRIQKLGIKKNQ